MFAIFHLVDFTTLYIVFRKISNRIDTILINTPDTDYLSALPMTKYMHMHWFEILIDQFTMLLSILFNEKETLEILDASYK